jgi:hypothetical protein
MKTKTLHICLIGGIHEYKLQRVIDVSDMVKRIRTNGRHVFALTIEGVIFTPSTDPHELARQIMHHAVRLNYWIGEFRSWDSYNEWHADMVAETTGSVMERLALSEVKANFN